MLQPLTDRAACEPGSRVHVPFSGRALLTNEEYEALLWPPQNPIPSPADAGHDQACQGEHS